MKAAPPSLPFVGSVGWDIEMGINPDLFKRSCVLAWISTKRSATSGSAVFEFPAAIADEHEFNFLFETGRIVDIIHGEGPAAEKADISKLVKIG